MNIASSGSSSPDDLVVCNGWLLFSADQNGDRELFRSDGTAAGTEVVTLINPNGDALITSLILLKIDLVASEILYYFLPTMEQMGENYGSQMELPRIQPW